VRSVVVVEAGPVVVVIDGCVMVVEVVAVVVVGGRVVVVEGFVVVVDVLVGAEVVDVVVLAEVVVVAVVDVVVDAEVVDIVVLVEVVVVVVDAVIGAGPAPSELVDTVRAPSVVGFVTPMMTTWISSPPAVVLPAVSPEGTGMVTAEPLALTQPPHGPTRELACVRSSIP
jgi:hypothetical protein